MVRCFYSLIEGPGKGEAGEQGLAVGDTHAGRDVVDGAGPVEDVDVINPVAAVVLDPCRY